MDIFYATAKGSWFRKYLGQIRQIDCKFTSNCTFDYNCVGFAAGDYLWWHPDEQREHYWPLGVPRNGLVTTYIQALQTVHFEECAIQNADLIPGFEKIAVFSQGKLFTHVAIVAGPDAWRSKLGELEDLEHPTVKKKMGVYGRVFRFLQRDAKFKGNALPDQYKL